MALHAYVNGQWLVVVDAPAHGAGFQPQKEGQPGVEDVKFGGLPRLRPQQPPANGGGTKNFEGGVAVAAKGLPGEELAFELGALVGVFEGLVEAQVVGGYEAGGVAGHVGGADVYKGGCL